MDPGHLANLIGRAQAKDADAFDELIDVFGPRLYGYLYRLTGGRDETEDLLQELFLRVVRTIEAYRHEDQFEAWVFRIATNLARDRLRRLKRLPGHISLDDHDDDAGVEVAPVHMLQDDSTPPPDGLAERSDEMDRLQHALEKLSQAEREVVMLRHFSQLSFQQIAQAMDTPLGTALARAHRGLAKLRALLGAST